MTLCSVDVGSLGLFGVVPVFVNTGAALLPAILAGLTSVLGLLFRPRELFRLCLRRPWVPILVIAVAVGGYFLIARLFSLAGASVASDRPARPDPRTGGDWASVALKLIEQEERGLRRTPDEERQRRLALEARVRQLEGQIGRPGVQEDALPREDSQPETAIYRGTAARCGYEGGGSPLKLKPFWEYNDGFTMYLASPLVVGDAVYGASCVLDPPSNYGTVFCLDAVTGEERWYIDVFTDPETGRERELKAFFSSPALSTDGKHVVIGQGLHLDNDCELICLDAKSGTVQWIVPTPLHIEGSPAIEGDIVVAGDDLPPWLVEEITAAYRELGSPTVAVRSSATAEDMAEASMAGQYETILDVSGEDALLDAVRQCWRSIYSERLQSYLAEQGIEPESVAMAVVVQRLVPADVAGVLFTANPRTAARDEMVIEAAWGLGEAVVSGMVQPDVVVLQRELGKEKSYAIADKAVWIQPGSNRQRSSVDQQRRKIRCLSDQNTRDLWDLGRRVVEYFGAEQDIEWAICDDEPFLLQSRPITTLDDADDYQQCIDETRRRLRQLKTRGRGDWVRHNIAETLPHPTPLTWTVIRRFMSGSGGFGTLYRKVGFQPSEQVCDDGFLELVAGRVYADLKLAPEMYFGGFPFRYDLDLLRCRPDAAQQPPTIPSGSWIQRAEMVKRLTTIERSLLQLAADCGRRLRDGAIPQFTAWVAEEKQRDLSDLATDEWHEVWIERERRVMDRFAPEILLPSLIAAAGPEHLRALLTKHFCSEGPDDLVNVLAVADKVDRTVQANEALRSIGAGRGSCDQWLAEFGHRGPGEFDLATPRWREQPDEVRKMAAKLADSPDPAAIHQRRLAEAEQCAAELRARLQRRYRHDFDDRLSLVRRYLSWREDGKAALMLGYDLMRDLALEAGNRLDIGSDIFLLTLDELRDALISGNSVHETIQERRRRRAAERRISLPLFIGAEEIENLGQPPETSTGRSFSAVPISTGSAVGPVQIVHSPREPEDLGRGYILVCPSTDPSRTPLFADAAGLVLECGGMLSHGAVVAREMGIPAVVLPEATRLLDKGETITVDGRHGVVLRRDADQGPVAVPVIDPSDVRVTADLIPPVRGPGERRAAALRNTLLLIWGVYLAAVFLLPRAWCYQPSTASIPARSTSRPTPD